MVINNIEKPTNGILTTENPTESPIVDNTEVQTKKPAVDTTVKSSEAPLEKQAKSIEKQVEQQVHSLVHTETVPSATIEKPKPLLIVDRLKKGLKEMIFKEQSGLVAGRQILDVVIELETIHSMASSSENNMFIKMDMAKAYEKVRWSFLRKVLSAYGFGEAWIQWVMSFVTSVSFTVIINGEHFELFGASWGI
ncbi:uncharacterized protein LOC131857889 [Cryptomeria japonica]|uniref:uncharacterized protein LOC131857889 n=1 Tax=Cryptomeria japonica TaxID=3369 RepID=UPI0027D9E51B|nr:uncharacterized protein LOC131857889 [Cryptomeria japonica]